MDSGPDNAGPLNSHLLVLRSLAQMHDVAPRYLDRFMNYVDALLWLDQAKDGGKPIARNGGNSARVKKQRQ